MAGSFLGLSIICSLRRKYRDWLMQSVKNVTDNEEQHALKLSLRCVEHEDFPVALPEETPFPLKIGEKVDRFIMLLLLKDFLNALRCFPCMKSYGRLRYTGGLCMIPVEPEAVFHRL